MRFARVYALISMLGACVQAQYTLISTGTCATQITSKAECEKAAASTVLGPNGRGNAVPATAASVISTSQYPTGCFLHYGQHGHSTTMDWHLYYNTKQTA